jgi:transcriptional regulator with XRE-family HTH domain
MSGRAEKPDLSNLNLDAGQLAELLGVSRTEVELTDAVMALVQRHAALITRMRERRGLSRADLARMLDLSPGRITQLESGEIRHAVNLKTLAEIAHKLDFDIDVGVQDRREPFVAVGGGYDLKAPMRIRVLPAVPSGWTTVAEVAGMNEAQAGLFARGLAQRIALVHPEAVEEAFVLQAAALIEEEDAVDVAGDE